MQISEQERAAYIAGDTNQADLLGQIDDLQRTLGDGMPRDLPDDDYILTEGAAWVEVQGFAVRIRANSSGLAVDVYESGKEGENTLASICLEPLEGEAWL